MCDFKVGQVVVRKDAGELCRISDIRMMEKDVPTYCDGNFFDTKGPFCKIGKTWVYSGQFRALNTEEIG